MATRIRDLRAQSSGPRAPDVAEHARDVIIVGSSSRGGSSIFAEILRRSPHLLHFRGETNPVFRLHGLDGAESDALPASTPVPAGLGASLGWECGQPTAALSGEQEEWTFALEIAVRLTQQWPDLEFPADAIHPVVLRVLRGLRQDEGWPEDRFVDPQTFHASLLCALRERWPEIHPGAYDIDRDLILARCPGPWPEPFVPAGLVEEPPFVLVTPWRMATEEQLATMPLVIKTPSNAYRMEWLRGFFSNARVRTLHLTRSVAASVNGLYDGWRYPGFHSHRLGAGTAGEPASLAIGGYSDVAPGGDVWWKFDRPPGWQAFTRADLQDVCAFQWRSAHLALLATGGADGIRVRFEDVLGERQRQAAAMRSLGAWLDVPLLDDLAHVLGGALPVVMATAPPRARRWFSRIDLLNPILANPVNRELMEALGYEADPTTWG